MKKLILTIAIVIGMTVVSFGQFQRSNGSRGLFERGETRGPGNRDISTDYPLLPAVRDGNHQDANTTPVGGGIAVLAALGGAYLLTKRRKEE